MSKLLHNEEFKRAVSIDEKKGIVTRKHVTESKSHGEVDCEWTFDFSKVTERELLEMASRSVLISYRPGFKKMNREDLEKNATQTIDVRTWIDSQGRSTKSAIEKVEAILPKLTKDELEQVQSMFLKFQAI